MSLNKPIYKLRDWIDINKLNYTKLKSNTNAITLLKSSNDIDISLLKKYPSIINCSILSENSNSIELLEQNQDKIDWNNLSRNPNAIKLLEKNQEKINWSYLSSNPSIFELDYEKMKINNQEMYEDLIKEVMKPSRVFKNPDYDYLEELFGD